MFIVFLLVDDLILTQKSWSPPLVHWEGNRQTQLEVVAARREDSVTLFSAFGFDFT